MDSHSAHSPNDLAFHAVISAKKNTINPWVGHGPDLTGVLFLFFFFLASFHFPNSKITHPFGRDSQVTSDVPGHLENSHIEKIKHETFST